MGLRQKIGVFVVLFFLPINGPILRMLMETQGMPPIGELKNTSLNNTEWFSGLRRHNDGRTGTVTIESVKMNYGIPIIQNKLVQMKFYKIKYLNLKMI